MIPSSKLRESLGSIDHKSYPAYKSLKGEYRFPGYILSIDHVQGDPFASPSHLSIRLPLKECAFPAEYVQDALARTTLADFLLRQFAEAIGRYSFRAKGSGKSGLIMVSRCGQEVFPRTACEITGEELIVRFYVGFPANGRTINSGELETILFDFLPKGVQEAFFYNRLDQKKLRDFMNLAEDQQALRKILEKSGMAAFVADGAVLPRESGISQKPMKGAVPFHSPERLRIRVDLPHRGPISGMGIPRGITLIVGGGYHGKSTLLDALQMGVYNHIPGDGRELVITDSSALKLRSEDGRFIKDTDISLFINNLPNKKDTRRFSTLDASGSTSQAAGIVEGIEAGSRVFLLDEDTSATNFMVRDSFMQRVIAGEKEPITPFVSRARELFESAGISTILVAGSSGAFFHIADTIIQMDNYVPVDITERVKNLLKEYPAAEDEKPAFCMPAQHQIMTRPEVRKSHKDYYGRTVDQPERLKIKTLGRNGFLLGHDEIDLSAQEQIADPEQVEAIARLLKYACENLIDGRRTLKDVALLLEQEIQKKGLSFFREGGYVTAGCAIPRYLELYAALCRFRRP